VDALRLLDAVNGGNVWVAECCERLGFALETGEAIWIFRECLRENLDNNLSSEVCVGSR
jgi:hypothetical protein